MTDRLDRLERHLSEVLAGPRRLMRSLSKTAIGTYAMTAQNETVAAVLADLKILVDSDALESVYAWLESALTKAGAVEPVAWIRYRPDGLWDGPIHSSEFTEYHRKSGQWTPLYAHAPPVVSGRKPLSKTMYRGSAHPEGCSEHLLDRRCLAADNVPTESLGRDAPAVFGYGDSCGACGDGCKDRGACRLADESPPLPAEPVESRYECRECDNCGHAGINDANLTQGACFSCEWSGPEPVEDKCPGCGDEGCMTAACPKCGARYRFIAELEPAILPAEPVASVPDGWVLVPIQYTKFMMDAAIRPGSQDQTGRREAAIWNAMIAAAPQPPTNQQGAAP